MKRILSIILIIAVFISAIGLSTSLPQAAEDNELTHISIEFHGEPKQVFSEAVGNNVATQFLAYLETPSGATESTIMSTMKSAKMPEKLAALYIFFLKQLGEDTKHTDGLFQESYRIIHLLDSYNLKLDFNIKDGSSWVMKLTGDITYKKDKKDLTTVQLPGGLETTITTTELAEIIKYISAKEATKDEQHILRATGIKEVRDVFSSSKTPGIADQKLLEDDYNKRKAEAKGILNTQRHLIDYFARPWYYEESAHVGIANSFALKDIHIREAYLSSLDKVSISVNNELKSEIRVDNTIVSGNSEVKYIGSYAILGKNDKYVNQFDAILTRLAGTIKAENIIGNQIVVKDVKAFYSIFKNMMQITDTNNPVYQLATKDITDIPLSANMQAEARKYISNNLSYSQYMRILLRAWDVSHLSTSTPGQKSEANNDIKEEATKLHVRYLVDLGLFSEQRTAASQGVISARPNSTIASVKGNQAIEGLLQVLSFIELAHKAVYGVDYIPKALSEFDSYWGFNKTIRELYGNASLNATDTASLFNVILSKSTPSDYDKATPLDKPLSYFALIDNIKAVYGNNLSSSNQAAFNTDKQYSIATLEKLYSELNTALSKNANLALGEPTVENITQNFPYVVRDALYRSYSASLNDTPVSKLSNEYSFLKGSMGVHGWLQKVVPFDLSAQTEEDKLYRPDGSLFDVQNYIRGYLRISYYYELLSYALVNHDKLVAIKTQDGEKDTDLVEVAVSSDGKTTTQVQTFNNTYILSQKVRDKIQYLKNNKGKEFNALELSDENKADIKKLYAVGNAFEAIGITEKSVTKDSVPGPIFVVLDAYFNVLKDYGLFLNDFESTTTFNAEDNDFPLKIFFNEDYSGMQPIYAKGIALSATYLPFETNVYKVSAYNRYIKLTDPFFEGFHYKYGFYRKALLRSMNPAAASTRILKQQDTYPLAVLTLRDFLDHAGDLVVYLDDNFYLTKEVSRILNMRNESAINSLVDEAKTAGETTVNFFANIFQGLSVQEFLKSNSYRSYNTRLGSTAIRWTAEKQTSWLDIYREPLMTKDEILAEFSKDFSYEYTFRKGFALVSAIYREPKVLNKLNALLARKTPVFISAPDVHKLSTSINDSSAFLMERYRNGLKKRIESAYEVEADLDKPIFMDVYGNILTESGYVVVPAIANPQMFKDNQYAPLSSAYWFINNEYNKALNQKDLLNASNPKFILDYYDLQSEEENSDLYPKDFQVGLNTINGAYLTRSNAVYAKLFYNEALDLMLSRKIDPDMYQVIATEVLRGAPLEYIDYEDEGIIYQRKHSALDMTVADLTDVVADKAFSAEWVKSSLISKTGISPKVYSQLEILIPVLIRVGFVLLILLGLIKIYKETVTSGLGIIGVGQLLLGTFILVGSFILVPKAVKLAYDYTSSVFLRNEVANMLLISENKRESNREVGVTDIVSYSNRNEITVKVGETNTNFYDVVSAALTMPAKEALKEAEKKDTSNTLLKSQKGIIKVGNDLLLPLDEIFDSTVIEYDYGTDRLSTLAYNHSQLDYFSFVSPYYALLEMQTRKINTFNNKYLARYGNSRFFNPQYSSNKQLSFLAVIRNYFLSDEFLDPEKGNDITGFRELYDLTTSSKTQGYYAEQLESELSGANSDMSSTEGYGENIIDGNYDIFKSIQKSQWYLDFNEAEIINVEKKIARIEYNFREFIKYNREAFDRLSDSAILKVLTMYLSIEHNAVFGLPNASKLELNHIDNRSILRYIISSNRTRYSGIYSSIGRLSLETSGNAFFQFINVILMILVFIAGYIKDIANYALVFGIFFHVFWNVAWRSSVLTDEQKTNNENHITSAIIESIVGFSIFIIYNVILTLHTKLLFAGGGGFLMSMIKVASLTAVIMLSWFIITTGFGLIFGKKTVTDAISMSIAKAILAKSFITSKANQAVDRFRVNRQPANSQDIMTDPSLLKPNENREGSALYDDLLKQEALRNANFDKEYLNATIN